MFFNIAKKGKNSIWIYIFGFILILFITNILGSIFIIFAIGLKNLFAQKSVFYNLNEYLNIHNLPFSSNVTLILLLIPFVIGFFFLILSIKFLHRRNFLSVLTIRIKFDISRVLIIFSTWVIFSMAFFFFNYNLNSENYIYQFELLPFLGLLFIVLLLMPFQAAFEEILIRGYLMQGIGLATNSRIIALFITSIVFGLMHSFNPEVANLGFWKIMPFYMGMGLFLGLVAIYDDGLEFPIGIHAAHNIFGALFVSSEQMALNTNSIFKMKELSVTSTDYMVFIVNFIVYFFILKWICKWKNLQRLFQPIKMN